MIKVKLTTKELECLRCGKKWVPRKEIVNMCPKCKSLLFDVKKTSKL